MANNPTYEDLEQRVKELEKVSVECKKVKENLFVQPNMYRTILDSTPDLFVVKDRNSVYRAANLAFCKFVGKKEEEIIGKTDFDLFPRSEAERCRRDDERIMETGIPQIEDEELTGSEGRKYLQVAKTPLVDKTGTCVGVLCSVRDVSKRKQAEEALQKARDKLEQRVQERTAELEKANERLKQEMAKCKQAEGAVRDGEQRYRSLVENIDLGVTLIDSGHNIVMTNAAHGKMFDKPVSELVGKKCFREFEKREVICPHCPGVQAMTTGRAAEVETQGIRDDGTRFDARVCAFPLFGYNDTMIGFIEVVEDITEKKELEARLQQAQKLEAIGTLAGGIAHDFNNALMPIIVNTQMALMDIPDGSSVRPLLEAVLKAGDHAKKLVRQILAFSRQAQQEQQPVRISPLIKETLKFLRSTLPSTIRIDGQFRAASDTVIADPTQIHQILLNLGTNAVHAMVEKGGVLSVSLTDIDVDSEAAAVHPDLRTGPYVRLTVSDTGHGMERAVTERIFEPFFTTKDPGKGTGMGLSTVHGIVKSHGGAIIVDSEPLKGSTFHVYLPLSDIKLTEEEPTTKYLHMGAEHILLVDDE